jgi:RNA polymerase sigma-70 factor (ECF subfamily)
MSAGREAAVEIKPAVEALGEASPGFEGLFHAHYEHIARLIARVVRDPSRAEEVTVEVFWKLWQNRNREGIRTGGWLYRVAVRAALDELRKQSRRERRERWFALRSRVRTPEELRAESEEQQQVRKVLGALPTRQAELLLLRADGLSYREIASSLSLNPASLGTLLSRAQEAFRKEYIKRYGKHAANE